MKDKSKFVLITFFRSLFSNDAAIDGAKKAPWWMALIMFLASVALPLVPISVNASRVKGSQSLGEYSLGSDTRIASVLADAKLAGYTFNIENGECVAKKDGVEFTNVTTEDAIVPLVRYESTRSYTVVNEDGSKTTSEPVHQYELDLYYCGRPLFSSKDSESVSDIITKIGETSYVLGTTNIRTIDPESTEEVKGYIPSFIMIHKTGLYTAIYSQDTTTLYCYTSFSSDWTHTKDCELLTRVLEVEDITGADAVATNPAYVEGVYNNYKKVVDETYMNAKTDNLVKSVLIYAGVYLVLIVMMGFMVWLLTRGKSNPFNYLTYWTTTKIAFWAALSPALLGMVLGFFITNYAPFIFIILLGLRTMWLSMKQLRPYQQ